VNLSTASTEALREILDMHMALVVAGVPGAQAIVDRVAAELASRK